MKIVDNSMKTIFVQLLLVVFISVVIVQSIIIYKARVNKDDEIKMKNNISKSAKIVVIELNKEMRKKDKQLEKISKDIELIKYRLEINKEQK